MGNSLQTQTYNENIHPSSRARRHEMVSERRAAARACHNWRELMLEEDIDDDVDDVLLVGSFLPRERVVGR